MSGRDDDLGRQFGAEIEPETLDWQHIEPGSNRDGRPWLQGAQDFDQVPPGGVGRWRPIGPAPLLVRNEELFCGPGPNAGQVRDLAIDPTPGDAPTIYMACNSAGIWKSSDGGASWRPLNDQLPSLRIGAVAVDFDNPQVVYAGSGNLFDGSVGERRGAGLFKSIDGGTTWMPIDGGVAGSELARGGINRIVVVAPDVLFVGTQSRLVLSTDGGASFGLHNAPHVGFIAALALDNCQRTTRRVRDATIATPIVLTCAHHGWRDNDIVYVGGVASNRAANGRWRVRVVDADRVELIGSAGNGVDAVSGYAIGPAHMRAITITNARVPAANRPVEITANAHGLLTGDIVAVHGVTGLVEANGSWSVEVLDANRVRLRGSRGNAAYTGGGVIDAADVAFELAVTNVVDEPTGAVFTVLEHGFADGDRTRVSGLANVTGNAANARVVVLDADRARLRDVHLAGPYGGGGTLRRPPAIWNTVLYTANGFFDRSDGNGPNLARGLFRMALTTDGPVRSNNLLANSGGFTATFNRVAFAQGGSGATRTLFAMIQHGGVPGINTTNRLLAFLRSANAGESWSKPGNLLTVTNGEEQDQSHYDLLLAVDPRNPRRVYAGMKQIWISEDAADHWTAQMPASESGWYTPQIAGRKLSQSVTHVHWDQHVFCHLPPTFWPPPAAPIPLYAGNDGGLVRTDDAGITYAQLNEGVATALLLSLDIGRGMGRNGVSFGGMWDNGTAGNRPARDARLRWLVASSGDGGAVAVDPSDPNIVFAVSNGSLVRSFDGGDTWELQGDSLIMPLLEVRNTNPVEIVMAGHPLQTGESVTLGDVQGGGGVANGSHTITRINDTTFSLNGVNGAAVPAFVQPQRVLGNRYARQFMITAATLSNPIEIETAEAHGLASGDQVNVIGVVGPIQANSAAANPWFTITVINARRFSLNGTDASSASAYVPGTGVVRGPRVAAQLVPIIFVTPFQAPAGTRPVVVTALGHRFVSGDTVTVTGVRGLTAANVANHPITVIDADSFQLDGLTTGQRFHVNARVRWPRLGNGLPSGGTWNTFVRIAIVPNPGGRATRIFVSVGRDLFRSDDAGRNFTRIHHNFPGIVTALLAPAIDRLWVGIAQHPVGGAIRSGEAWHSRDGGAHWLTEAADNFVSRLGGRGSVSAIAEDPHDPDRVAVGFAGYSNTDPRFRARHAFLTTTRGIRTGGAHPWEEISGTSFNVTGNLPDLPVLSIAFDATTTPSQLLVATDLGVLRRTTTGWERVGSNLPRVSCQALAVDNTVTPGLPSVIRVATYGRSAWELERPATGALEVICDSGFAPALVGTTRTQMLVLHNAGGAAVQVTQIQFFAAGFALSAPPVLPMTLAAGASRSFELRFAPTTTGIIADTLQIDSDDPGRPTRLIELRGIGASAGGRPRITFTRRLRFGSTLVGRTRDLPLTLENLSLLPARVTNVSLFAPVPGLTVDAAPPRPITLAPGASQTIMVHYAPTAVAAAGFREDIILETQDTAGNNLQFELIQVVGSAQTVGTDLLTNLLAVLGLADPPDNVIV